MDRYENSPGCFAAFQEVEVESMEPMSVQTTGGMAAGWDAQVTSLKQPWFFLAATIS